MLSEGSIFVIPSENASSARTEESLTRRKYLEMSRLRSTRQKRPERRRQNDGYCEQNALATLTGARALSAANLPPESRPGSLARAADYGRRNDRL